MQFTFKYVALFCRMLFVLSYISSGLGRWFKSQPHLCMSLIKNVPYSETLAKNPPPHKSPLDTKPLCLVFIIYLIVLTQILHGSFLHCGSKLVQMFCFKNNRLQLALSLGRCIIITNHLWVCFRNRHLFPHSLPFTPTLSWLNYDAKGCFWKAWLISN